VILKIQTKQLTSLKCILSLLSMYI